MGLPEALPPMSARVLLSLLERGSATRPELSEALGITKQTVSIAVEELEARTLVQEVARQQGHTGRSAARYGLHAHAGWVAGIELGTSRLRVAAARLDGTVVAHRVVANPAPTVVRDWPERLELAAHALAEMAQKLTESEGGLLGVAIAVPRPVDVVRDLLGQDSGEGEDQLLAALAPVSPAAVWTENDVNCGALAQQQDPGNRGRSSLVYLHVGFGVGAALVLDGSVVRGHRGHAGQVAGMCISTSRGPARAEDALSAEALLGAAGHSVSAPLLSSLDDLFAAAELGDPAAQAAIDAEADGLAQVVSTLCAVTDPEVVVLNGLLGGRGDVRKQVAAACADLGVRAEVVEDALGDAAPVIGAATLAAARVVAALTGR